MAGEAMLSLQTSLPKPPAAMTAMMSSLLLSAENFHFLVFIVVDSLVKGIKSFWIQDIYLRVGSGIRWAMNL